jgi:Flp pilus assembly protein TadD
VSGARPLVWAAVASATLLVVVLGLQRIASVDYWWQLQTGADVAHHGIPRTELYSFTQPDVPRVEVRWLYCLALWSVVHVAGPAGATLVKTALGVLLFGLAATLGGRRTPSAVMAAIVAIAALACSQRWVVRPEIVTYVMVIAYVAIIVRLQARPSRWAWALPVLQAIWVNTHGLFLLGPAIVGAWLVAEMVEGLFHRGTADADRARRWRTAALLLAATFAACAASPYGPRVVAVAIAQFGALRGSVQKTFFTELRSPFDFTQSFAALFYYKVLIALTLLTGIFAWRSQRLFWLLLVGSQLYLSVAAVRNVPLFCIVAVPYVLRNLDALAAAAVGQAWFERRRPVAATLLAVATLGFCSYQIWRFATDRFTVSQHALGGFGLGIAPHVFPSAAVDLLDRSDVRGPLLSSETTGSYLIARGRKVFLDPRGDVYPDAFLEQYRALALEPDATRVQALVRMYKFQGALIDLDVPRLVQYLWAAPGWRLVHLDSESALFLRDGVAPELPRLDLVKNAAGWYATARAALPAPRPRNAVGIFGRVSNPAPYDRLARTLFDRQLYALAEPLYVDALAADPGGFLGWAQFGHLAVVRHDYSAGLQRYDRALQAKPGDAELHWRAGIAALQARRLDVALQHANAALEAAPNDWQKMALKGTVELERGRGTEAESWLERAIEQSPAEPSLYRSLAKAQYLQGRIDAAVASFEKTCQLDPRDASAARDLARILAQRGDGAEARVWLDKALALDPRDPQALALRTQLEGRTR